MKFIVISTSVQYEFFLMTFLSQITVYLPTDLYMTNTLTYRG